MAMLVLGFTIVMFGLDRFHFELLLIFAGPIFVNFLAIIFLSKKCPASKTLAKSGELKIFPILKLTVFIVFILAASKYLQILFGNLGLFVLTFIVSLFEIHGSMIANIQLHNAEMISLQTLGMFLCLSIAASFISKIGLVMVLATRALSKVFVFYCAILILSLSVGWAPFYFLSSY
jgi:uncharacterized membrane protein (DUF4010 family)